jgi:hypothetical protein
MNRRRLHTMDLRTLLVHIRENPSDRAIARDLGLDRRTVGRYRLYCFPGSAPENVPTS